MWVWVNKCSWYISVILHSMLMHNMLKLKQRKAAHLLSNHHHSVTVGQLGKPHGKGKWGNSLQKKNSCYSAVQLVCFSCAHPAIVMSFYVNCQHNIIILKWSYTPVSFRVHLPALNFPKISQQLEVHVTTQAHCWNSDLEQDTLGVLTSIWMGKSTRQTPSRSPTISVIQNFFRILC